MTSAEASVRLASRDDSAVLVGELKSSLLVFKRGKSEDAFQRLLTALNRICVAFCFGDEEFIRRLDVERYASVLVSTLRSVSRNEFSRLRSVTVQALALLADLVPRGGLAIAAAKGIRPLFCIMKDVKLQGNETFLEELLKCISHVSAEAKASLVHEYAVSFITILEARVETHHLRMLCLKCLCHLLEAARLKDWNKYFLVPCNTLVVRFSQQVKRVFGESKDQPLERLSKENEAYMLRLTECVALIYDRILRTRELILKNGSILENSLPAFVNMLLRTASMGTQGSTFRDAVCSPLLTLFFADPPISLRMFLKYHVLQSICGVLATVLERTTKRISYSGVAFAEAFLSNDVSAIPFMAEEKQIIHLLEFFLVIFPTALVARESDYYVTLPHFVWQCEDDFHNRTDCTDSLSKQMEGEYKRQRRLSAFKPYEVCNASRTLKIDFDNMQYMSTELSSYPHSLGRHAFLSGYVHSRVMYCNCGDKLLLDTTDEKFISKQHGDHSSESPKWTYRHQDNPLVANSTEGSGAVNEDIFSTITARSTDAAYSHRIAHSGGLREAAINRRLVDGNECGSWCAYIAGLVRQGERQTGRQRTGNKTIQRKDLLLCEFFRNSREGILNYSIIRLHFLHDSMIQLILSWCLPVLTTMVRKTVSPIIARHCSILILRCVDLSVEFFRDDGSRFRPKVMEELRQRFNIVCSQLGPVLSYLATANTNHTITAFVQPFKEFQNDHSFLQALMAVGLKPNSRLPAMTLRCEIQMSALSSVLILQHACRSTMSIFNGNQKLILCRMLENLKVRVSRHQGVLRSSIYGGTGIILCPFHVTAEKIEEVHAKLIEQAILVISLDLGKVYKGHGGTFLSTPFKLTSATSSSNRDHTNSSLARTAVLVEPKKFNIPESCIISDIMIRANMHSDLPTGLQKVFAIHEYMLECETNLSSLVYGHPEFLEELACELQNSTIEPALNKDLAEAFSHVRKGLLSVINKNIGLVNAEDAPPIERQSVRPAHRLRRNKITLAMANHIWTPLRVKLESLDFTETDEHSPSSVGIILIADERYTVLDLSLERETVSILPTMPLSHLAKHIVLQLNQKYMDAGKCKAGVRLGRRHTAPDAMEVHSLYSTNSPFLPKLERVEGDLGQSFLSRSYSILDSHVSNEPESTESSFSNGSLVSWENNYESERRHSAASVRVQSIYDREESAEGFSIERQTLPDPNDDTSWNILPSNIVFFYNGKPVVDLSVSLLELFWDSTTVLASGMAATTEKEKAGEQLAATGMQRMLSMWLTTQTIHYLVVKEPFMQSLDGATEDRAYGTRISSPKKIFTYLLSCSETQSSLKVAAKLLNEMRRVLLSVKATLGSSEGRLCSALIYGFHNHIGIFMLPSVVWLPLLCSSLNEQQDQHLASYILWNYPQIFSLDVRRALIQLIFSVRRVPIVMLAKLKESARLTGYVAPVHGLDWVTPDVDMRSTKKVVVQRDNLLESGSNVLRTHAMCPLPLSVEFENENGVGAGPAVEFYNLFSAQLQEQRLNMWRTEEFTDSSGALTKRVQLPLFPAVCQTAKSLSYFELLGLLVGRVLLEGRVVDLPLHHCFIQGILGNLEKNRLRDIDPELDYHLSRLSSLSEEELIACDLTFVLPRPDAATAGEEIELTPNGSMKRVTGVNVSEYVTAVRQYYCRTVLTGPLMHFRQGLRYAIIPSYLELFSVEELQLLISGPDGKIWERPEDLERIIILSHGYDKDSPVVNFLLEVVSSWDAPLQRAFLRFVTGSSRLPLGGMRPPITVVRRTLGVTEEEGGNASFWAAPSFGEESRKMQLLMDASLPTVNTCAHYLKLPSYSSKALLEEKLRTAVTEGQESFLLT
ncbi:ubiquitin-protein ligase [Trypanosoma cruzi]|nr:ubiquitin-protein ligase [Trypanosoma cruzi]